MLSELKFINGNKGLYDRPTISTSISDIVKGYTAGMMDGEGSIGIYIRKKKNKYNDTHIIVNITNTNKESLLFIQKYYNGKITTRKSGVSILMFRYNEVLPLLIDILDFLIIKKEKAEKLIKFIRERGIYNECIARR